MLLPMTACLRDFETRNQSMLDSPNVPPPSFLEALCRHFSDHPDSTLVKTLRRKLGIASSNPTSTHGERDFQLAGLVSVAYRTRAIGLYSFILPLANFNVAIADDQSISRVGDPRREPMPQFQDSR